MRMKRYTTVCEAARGVPRPAPLAPRPGLSLLEVLISMFIVAIGMLGVAAMIPLGRFAVVETAKADRSAACGRSAMCQVRARGLLAAVDPDRRWPLDPTRPLDLWWWPNYEPRQPSPNYPGNYIAANVRVPSLGSSGSPLLWALDPRLVGQPFVIDPLLVGEMRTQVDSSSKFVSPGTLTDPTVARFPYEGDIKFALPRLTVNVFDLTTFDPAGYPLPALLVWERIFRWEDDRVFTADEDDPLRRPQQSLRWNDAGGSFTTEPPVAGAAPLVGEAQGKYTWLVTAVPSPSETPPTKLNPTTGLPEPDYAALAADHQRTYRVSVVVFYGRELTVFNPGTDKPSERDVSIVFTGGGFGGGDAVLVTPQRTPPILDAEQYLDVKPGQWIMVHSVVVDPRMPLPAVPPRTRKVIEWYRVVSADDVEPNNTGVGDLDKDGHDDQWLRRVTLAGPDWPCESYGTIARAALVDGAIGVYTKTIPLEKK